jgi:hypothetical protein
MVRQTRLRLLLLVLVFGAGSCSLDNTGDVATNEPFGKWIVLTWSIPPIGEVKIDSILFSCHIQPGGLNRTASATARITAITKAAIPPNTFQNISKSPVVIMSAIKADA